MSKGLNEAELRTDEPILASVIVPAYNAKDYVANAVHSAQIQSEARIEILVIDDCSSDTTGDIVRQIAQQDPRVRLIQMAANSGPAAARNAGIDAAKGEWIALLDADDQYTSSRLKELLTAGAEFDADIVSDNLLLCPNGDRAKGQKMIPEDLLSRPVRLTPAEFVRRNVGSREHALVRYGFLHPIIRRDFLLQHRLRYDEANRFGEDFMLYTKCLVYGAQWWMTPEATYLYNVRDGSLTQVQTSADLNRIRVMEETLLADPRVTKDHELVSALRRHKRVIDRSYSYRAFTDALKGRRPAEAVGLLFEDGRSVYHIAAESLAQLPTVLRKALDGGYFSRAPRVK